MAKKFDDSATAPDVEAAAAAPGPATLEAALDQLVFAWNRAHAMPLGPRVLHRLFGQVIPSDRDDGCHSFASLIGGTARVIGPDELLIIPQVIAEVCAEAEHARAVREGRE